MLGQYSKAIAAAVGLAAILFKDIFGVEIGTDTVDKLVNGLLAVGTWIAVFQARNKPA